MNNVEYVKSWMLRVADEVSNLRTNNELTKSDKLNKISETYDTLAVLIMVLEGRAYMTGITPIGE